MKVLRIILAWTMLVGGLTVDALAWAGVVAKKEPKFVLHLSTAALIFEGANAVQLAHKED